MASPNIKNPATIIGLTTSVGIATTAFIGIITNTSNSNKVYKINSIFAANVNTLVSADINITILRNGVDRYLARSINVLPGSTQIISTKDTYFYIEENVAIRAKASIPNGIDVVLSYEEIS
jgi:hypothetical protein